MYYTPMGSAVQVNCIKARYHLAVSLALVYLCCRGLATHELFQVLRTAAEELTCTTFVQLQLQAELILLRFASMQPLKSAMQENKEVSASFLPSLLSWTFSHNAAQNRGNQCSHQYFAIICFRNRATHRHLVWQDSLLLAPSW